MKETPAMDGGKPVRKKFLVFGAPDIREDEIKEVVKTLKSSWIGTGPKTHEFEENFRAYIGTKYAVALNSCTAGLHLALVVLGVKAGDEVVTTPLTFTSTANVIVHQNAKPVFVDVERDTMNIDPQEIEKKITPRTKAIIPVHLAGRPCKMDEIMAIAGKRHIAVIEDAAHAIESEYKGKKIGAVGDMAAFSFYVTKNLVTAEGGMVTTDNAQWAEKIRVMSLHGISKDAWKRYSAEGYQHYDTLYPGFKYNMTDIQASMGLHQLKRIEGNLKVREKVWKKYNKAFSKIDELITPIEEDNIRHARHLYTILIRPELLKIDRNHFMEALRRENIGSGIHFIALHLHSYYKNAFGYKRGDFPNAEWISDRTISLPLSSRLTEKDADDVIEAVTKVVGYYRK
jgi:dTDP-4-amino-4,6-dideoxygalactose transaminase